ncbi:aldehyde dehydrogenase family protein [Clostridiaceae bacterium 35-E11]
MNNKQYIDELVAKARAAQREFENFNQEQVDAVVREIGKVVYDNAVELARMAVDETGMGVFEDKIAKNKGKAKVIWNHLRGKKSVGIIHRDEETGIVEVAKPMGVVGSVTPCTNPIVTPMSNAMFALKGKNAIIIAPHPRAKKCSTETVRLINQAIAKYNVPENMIQIIEEPSIELTNLLMQATDVVVATGGMGMVKAAYSSGKPAYGVGAGNVQCIIDRDVDIKEVVPKIIVGRTFDNGIICSGEQTVIAPEEDYDRIIAEFKNNGAHYINDAKEKEALRKVMFINGVISKDIVGQTPEKIGQLAGIDIPKDTKVILIEADGIGEEDVLCKEKMCPVMATFKYKDFSEAVHIAQTNLDIEGKGHSAAVHSNNKENIEYAGRLTVSRLVVNQPCATSAGGSFFNGFAPTTTLGCGSWGNNSISENFTYKHLINISRIGYYMKDAVVPSDEELWVS